VIEAHQYLRDFLVQRGISTRYACWVALDGGRTNRVWRVEGSDQTLICKLYRQSPDNPLYPNLPGIEYEMLSALSQTGMAPRPVALFHTDMGDLLVYRHLAGVLWSSGVTSVARLLSRVHGTKPPIALRRLASGSGGLVRQTRYISSFCRGRAADMPDFLRDRHIAPARQLRLIHTDAVPGNLVITRDGLRLIDWQCPALGDPCEDLASFLSPGMQQLYRGAPLKRHETVQFLATYPDQRMVARYRRLAPFFHWRTAAYCQWRLENGAPDYRLARDLEIAALNQTYTDQNDAGEDDANCDVA